MQKENMAKQSKASQIRDAAILQHMVDLLELKAKYERLVTLAKTAVIAFGSDSEGAAINALGKYLASLTTSGEEQNVKAN